ncbi:MAG: hypothetical protein IJE84_02570, partial [Clostridia bacterium]|nr:hypothetical protein [Clostridia bacterium]
MSRIPYSAAALISSADAYLVASRSVTSLSEGEVRLASSIFRLIASILSFIYENLSYHLT